MNKENKRQPKNGERYRGQALINEAQYGMLRLSSIASGSGMGCMALEDRPDARIELFVAAGTLAAAGVLFVFNKVKGKRT